MTKWKQNQAEQTPAFRDVFEYVNDNGAYDTDGSFTLDATTIRAWGMIGCLAPWREAKSPIDGKTVQQQFTPKTGTPEFHAWKALEHCKSEIIGPSQVRYRFDAEGMRHLRRAAFGETEIRVNLDNDTITLGPESHPVTHDQAGIVDKLLKENGGWVPSKNMGFPRADRIIDRMPGPVKQRIESKTGTGYRIHI